MLKEIIIHTKFQTELINVDDQIRKFVDECGIHEGYCIVWSPHTTAGITVNENCDPDVKRDINAKMDHLIPHEDDYHHMEGNSAAHIKTSLFGPSLTLIISKGAPLLGTWQSVYFCEFDGPRTRRMIIKAVED